MATRKPKSTAGAADSVGGAVTSAALAQAKAEPNLNAAVGQLMPYAQTVLQIVRGLQVRNEAERHVMADALRQIKTGMEAIDARFDPITKPMWAAWQAALAWRREVRTPLEQAEFDGKDKLGRYEVELAQMAREAAAEREQHERNERERDRARAAAFQAQAQAPVIAGYQYVPAYQPQPEPYAPAVYADPMASVRGPAPLAGVSTVIEWTVQVTDSLAAARALVAHGLWDMSQLPGVAPFVRLDVPALVNAVKGEGDTAQWVRHVLNGCPGLNITQSAQVRTRKYSPTAAADIPDDDVPF